MANKNGEKKTVEIKENPATTTVPATTPETDGQNPAEEDVKYTFGYCLKHPIKAIKHAAKEHPVATAVTGTAVAGGLVFGIKCIADAIGGGESSETEDEDLDDVLEDEDEDDEEDEI